MNLISLQLSDCHQQIIIYTTWRFKCLSIVSDRKRQWYLNGIRIEFTCLVFRYKAKSIHFPYRNCQHGCSSLIHLQPNKEKKKVGLHNYKNQSNTTFELKERMMPDVLLVPMAIIKVVTSLYNTTELGRLFNQQPKTQNVIALDAAAEKSFNGVIPLLLLFRFYLLVAGALSQLSCAQSKAINSNHGPA